MITSLEFNINNDPQAFQKYKESAVKYFTVWPKGYEIGEYLASEEAEDDLGVWRANIDSELNQLDEAKTKLPHMSIIWGPVLKYIDYINLGEVNKEVPENDTTYVQLARIVETSKKGQYLKESNNLMKEIALEQLQKKNAAPIIKDVPIATPYVGHPTLGGLPIGGVLPGEPVTVETLNKLVENYKKPTSFYVYFKSTKEFQENVSEDDLLDIIQSNKPSEILVIKGEVVKPRLSF